MTSQPTVDDGDRQREHEAGIARGSNRTTVLVAVIAALATLVVGFFGGRQSADTDAPSSPVDVDAGDVMSLQSPTLRKTNQIGLSEQTITVTGNLKEDLPSGMQIWVASRKETDPSDNGRLGYAEVGFEPGPCDVDLDANTFDCGAVTLGDQNEAGTFYVFVMLADSTASRRIVEILSEQLTANDYRHSAPEIVATLPSVVVERS